jgi:hypothetical protein
MLTLNILPFQKQRSNFDKLAKNGAYKILVAPKDTITKITGIITPKSINSLENKLGGAFTILKSTHFTKDQMVAWKNKTATQQTWQNLQDYFTEKWLEQRQYLQATAKRSRFKDAALSAQELAAAGEEGETTAMMFTLPQEQHKAQLKLILAANKLAMDTMIKCMNALRGPRQGGGQGYCPTCQQQHRQCTQPHEPHQNKMHKL